MWEISSQSKLLFSLGDLNTTPPFSLLKHIRRAVCSPRRRITQPSVWYISLFLLFSHYSVFSKASTDVLLRPTLLPAAIGLCSLRELTADAPISYSSWVFVWGEPSENTSRFPSFKLEWMSLRNSFTKLSKTINKLDYVKGELINMTWEWDKNKIPTPTGIKPIISRTLEECSIHWATRTRGEQGHFTGVLPRILLSSYMFFFLSSYVFSVK